MVGQIELGATIATVVIALAVFVRKVMRERVADRRAKAAHVRAVMMQRPYGRLTLVNDGPGAARHVNVIINEKPLKELYSAHQIIVPIASLAPHAEVDAARIIVHDNQQADYSVDVVWEDDSGQPGRWKSRVTLS